MPHFLRLAVGEIGSLVPEPDRWRSPTEFALKNAQDPDHFLDMERVSWLDPLPPGRYEFYRKLYKKCAAVLAQPDSNRAKNERPDDYLPERPEFNPYSFCKQSKRMSA